MALFIKSYEKSDGNLMIWLRIMLKIILVFSLILKSSILNVDFIIILADNIK